MLTELMSDLHPSICVWELASNNAHHSTVTLRGSLSMRQGQEMMFTEIDRYATSICGPEQDSHPWQVGKFLYCRCWRHGAFWTCMGFIQVSSPLADQSQAGCLDAYLLCSIFCELETVVTTFRSTDVQKPLESPEDKT